MPEPRRTFRRKILLIGILSVAVFLSFSTTVSILIIRDVISEELDRFQYSVLEESSERFDLLYRQIQNVVIRCEKHFDDLHLTSELSDFELNRIVSDNSEIVNGFSAYYPYFESVTIVQQYREELFSILGNQPDTTALISAIDRTGKDLDEVFFLRQKHPTIEESDRIYALKLLPNRRNLPQWVMIRIKDAFLHQLANSGTLLFLRNGDGLTALRGHPKVLPDELPAENKTNRSFSRGKKIGDYLVFMSAPFIAQLQLISCVPVDVYSADMRTLSRFIILVSIGCFICSSLLLFMFSGFFSREIKALTRYISSLPNSLPGRMGQEHAACFQPSEHRQFRLFSKLSVRVRTGVFFTVSVGLPLILTYVVIYPLLFNQLDLRTRQTAEYQLEQLVNRSDFILRNYQSVISSLSINTNIQEALGAFDRTGRLDELESVLAQEYANYLLATDDLASLHLPSKESQRLVSLGGINPAIDLVMEDLMPGLQSTYQRRVSGFLAMGMYGTRSIVMGLQVREISTYALLGYLFIEFRLDRIFSVLEQNVRIQGGRITLLTPDSRVFYQYRPFSYDVKDGGEVDLTKNLESNDWLLILSVSAKEYAQRQDRLLQMNLVLGGFLLLLLWIVAMQTAAAVTQNLRTIEQGISQSLNGDFKPISVPATRNEIEVLGHEFNYMVEQINSLVQSIYKQGMEKRTIAMQLREAEMSALQSQITPHFLYNTLESIQSLILMRDQRATIVMEQLGELLHGQLDFSARYHTVQQELHNLDLYLRIQEIRYPDRFTVVRHLAPDIQGFYVIRFFLQPIVENAILHGFTGVDQSGTIELHVQADGQTLEFRVLDNGGGIDPEHLNTLQASLRSTENSGGEEFIGLRNVNERLRLLFGSQHGIEIEHRDEGGVCVRMTMPVLETLPGKEIG